MEYPKSCPRKRFAVDVTAIPSFTPEEMEKANALVEKMAVMSAYRLAQVLNTIFKY